jgi:hypothetical protein
LLLVILFNLWSGIRHQTKSPLGAAKTNTTTEDHLTAPVIKPSAPTDEEPSPLNKKALPTPPIVPTQTIQAQNQPSEIERERANKMQELLRPKEGGPLKLLKRVYARESRDATAKDTEQLIRKESSNEYLPAELFHNVTCHKSVCKVEVSWSEKNPYGLMALAMKLGPRLTGHIAYEPALKPDRDGRLPVTVYILRTGYALEDIE